MKRLTRNPLAAVLMAALLALPPATGFAQVPVDDDGEPIGDRSPIEATGADDIPLLDAAALDELVGPIALYPDDLLAIVLPASAYPLQIVEAARFLEALEADDSLKPDPDWDDSVVALLNYPEIVELMNDDIDWTWRLGEAVVAQQPDVVGAIENFRDRAYAAGNLKSDAYQNVTRDEGVIEITPVSDDVIYVPYYEPERVVVYQPRPVYYYYPRAYPVYYYPYPAHYHFDHGFFWGVTTAFTIGWISDSLHVYHHSYYGHPFYGHRYYDYWWYRRPTINVYNTTYVNRSRVTINNYYSGDEWRPRRDRREYVSHDRRDYLRHDRDVRDYYVRETHNRYNGLPRQNRTTTSTTSRREQPIRFRERPERERQDLNVRNRQETTAMPREGRDVTAARRSHASGNGTPARENGRRDGRDFAARSERESAGTTARRSGSSNDVAGHTGNDQPARSFRSDRRETQARVERREQPRQTERDAVQPQATQREQSRRTERNAVQPQVTHREQPRQTERRTVREAPVQLAQRSERRDSGAAEYRSRSPVVRETPRTERREAAPRAERREAAPQRSERASSGSGKSEARADNRRRGSGDDGSRSRERRH